MTEYTDDVKLMLTTHPESRDSDTLLYEVFLKDKGYDTSWQKKWLESCND